MQERTIDRFRDWFWRPPRRHGETVSGRSVSNLELLYDLVYVAVVGQAALRLAGDTSVRGTVIFAVVFTLIWVAWINGSLYIELHGRQDGRTRAFVFLQMTLLALLAVFAASAPDAGGAGFALTYAAFLLIMAWLWYSVRRQDRQEYMAITAAWLLGLAISVVLILASAILSADARLLVWAAVALGWMAAIGALGRRSVMFQGGARPSESMVERFGLFIIIVLGEVVIGVVTGLSEIEPDPLTIATGFLALASGFGFWWMYFDIIGGRLPRANGASVATWVLAHLPISLAIAAAGAAIVSLIGHAHDPAAPALTAWLLSGAVAVGLVGLIAAASALEDGPRLARVYRPLALAMAAGGAAALLVGWTDPAPWLLALLVDAILVGLWAVAIAEFLRAGAWAESSGDAKG